MKHSKSGAKLKLAEARDVEPRVSPGDHVGALVWKSAERHKSNARVQLAMGHYDNIGAQQSSLLAFPS